MFLSSHVRAAAQTVPPQIVLPPAPAAIQTVPAPLLASSFLLSKDLGNSPAHLSYRFTGVYERQLSLESLSPVHEVKTLFLTQSSLPLLDLWGGHLRLDGFTSNLDMQKVQLGPSGLGGLRDFRPSRLGYPSGPRSVGLKGLSLNFYFGPDAEVGRPEQIWRWFARIVTARR